MSVKRALLKLQSYSGRESESVAGLCQNDVEMPRAGFEPATTRSSAERSPRLSYLGTIPWE
jgi:hypothetical protein